MTREVLNSFENRNNVTKITSDDGSVNYLTQSTPLAEEADRLGATTYDVASTKPVLLLFNKNKACVGKAYMAKATQGMSPSEIADKEPVLCIFESWYAEKKTWIPCVSMSANQGPSENAAARH